MRSPGLTATAGALLLGTRPQSGISRPPFRDDATRGPIPRCPNRLLTCALSRRPAVYGQGDLGQPDGPLQGACEGVMSPAGQVGTTGSSLLARLVASMHRYACSRCDFTPVSQRHPRRLPAAGLGSTKSSTMREGNRVRLYTRTGYNWTSKYPWIVDALASLRVRSCIIDGEAVWAGKDEKSDFDRLHSGAHDDQVFL
jgi:hypothetical protein